MSKIRVHELAKELDKPNKDIMQILSDNKIEVKSHMSTLTEDDVKLVKNYYHKQTTAGKEEPAGKMEEKKETKEYRPDRKARSFGKRNMFPCIIRRTAGPT